VKEILLGELPEEGEAGSGQIVLLEDIGIVAIKVQGSETITEILPDDDTLSIDEDTPGTVDVLDGDEPAGSLTVSEIDGQTAMIGAPG